MVEFADIVSHLTPPNLLEGRYRCVLKVLIAGAVPDAALCTLESLRAL